MRGWYTPVVIPEASPHPIRRALTSMVAFALCAGTVVGLGAAEPSAAAAPQLRELPQSPLVANMSGDPVVAAHGATSYTSAAIGDVTGDGNADVVVGSLTSRAFVFDLSNGRTIELDPGGTDAVTSRGATQASPALGDIDGDGVDDVVIANLGNHLAAYSVIGGTPHALYVHAVPPAFEGAGTGLFGTPAIGYVDADEQLDVVTSQWGQTIDAWSGPTGAPVLRQWLKDSIWSSPAVGDVDGDGQAEIVVGGDCAGADPQQPCWGNGHGGYVWAFNLDGSLQWSYYVRGAVVWSSPALSDLNGDGALDVVVGTGLYYDEPPARRIRAIDGRTGTLLWEAETPGRVLGSPSVAAVDGTPQVWVVSEGGELLSWNATGQRLWARCIADQPCNPAIGTFGGVSIADVDGDGRLEALVQAEQTLRVLDAATGEPEASIRGRYGATLFPSYGTPTVAEIDGQTVIAAVNVGDASGDRRIDGGDDMVVALFTTGTALGEAPWPTFKRNMLRTSGPLPTPPPLPIGPNGRVCAAVSGGAEGGALVNLTPVLAEGAGNGLLVSSDLTTPPNASNANYAPGTVDPNVAIAPIGRDGQVCYVNSRHTSVHLIADHLGTIDADAYTPATPTGAPDRKIDTRRPD